MIEDFKLNGIEENIEFVTIVAWHKKVGDSVSEGELLLEVMTDKVNLEVYSDRTGVVTEIIADVDAEISPKEVVARIEVAG